ncbi:MAG: hypothetical protein WB660_28570 [Candidatus Sulfotelmatobacter sp.]
MNIKTYEADYEATMTALQAAIQKRDQIDGEIASLSDRKEALETLIRAAYPHKGRLVLDENMSSVSAVANVAQPRVTEAVKGILMASKEPLTSAEIHERLPQFGWKLDPKSNPWALIHGIGRRLVDQQFAREVEKGGRKAWVRARI